MGHLCNFYESNAQFDWRILPLWRRLPREHGEVHSKLLGTVVSSRWVLNYSSACYVRLLHQKLPR